MANRRCYTYPTTNFILPTVFQNRPPSQIEPKYISTISHLLTTGLLQDTVDHSYSAFVAATKGQTAITPQNVYSLYETYILDIIQYVIDGVAIDTILTKLQPMQQEIRSLAQAEATILVIEEVMLSIVNNLTSKLNIGFVLSRITYLKGLVASAQHLPAAYGELSELIGSILTSIANREPIESVLANLMSIQISFASEVKLAEVLTQIQTTVISILQNIINRVDIQLVLNRFTYVRQLLAEAATL
jgi:hypothetical protein